MRMRRIPAWAAVALVAAAVVACNVQFSTANIRSAKLARDKEGTQPTTVFGQNDVFWCIVQLANAPDDTTVKAAWTAVEAEGVEPNYAIDSKEITTGSTVVNFNLSNNQLWPVGKYKVDLYLNGKLDRTLEFTVEAAGGMGGDEEEDE